MPAFPASPKPLAALCAGLLLTCAGGLACAQTAPPAAPAVPPPPAQQTSFDEVTARLERGGTLYLYLSTEQWLAHLSQSVLDLKGVAAGAIKEDADPAKRDQTLRLFDDAARLIQQSGLEAITGVGASSVLLEPGVYRHISFVHHYAGKENGFLGRAFGRAPHGLAALDFLPADTALASYGDVDLPLLFGAVEDTVNQSGLPDAKKAFADGLKQLSDGAGMPVDTLARSLGTEIGLVVTLDPARTVQVPMGAGQPVQTIPLPRLALIFQTKDDTIFKRVDQSLGKLPGLVKVDEPGLRLRTYPVPATADFSARATVAQWGRLLVFASDDQLVRDMAAAQKSGQGFKATPEFTRLATGMPAEGNGFSVMSQRLVDAVRQFQTEMFKSQPGMTPQQTLMMQRLMAYQQSSASYSVAAHVENGWLTTGKSGQNVNQIVVPLVALPVGAAAGFYGVFAAGMEVKGRGETSLANAKEIAAACQEYAEEHDGKYPPTLDALSPDFVPDKKTLASPFAPDQPVGYNYTPGLTKDAPPETVLLEDRFSVKASHERVVVRVDGTGEVTKGAE